MCPKHKALALCNSSGIEVKGKPSPICLEFCTGFFVSSVRLCRDSTESALLLRNVSVIYNVAGEGLISMKLCTSRQKNDLFNAVNVA